MNLRLLQPTAAILSILSGSLFAQTSGSWNDGAANDNWLDADNWTSDPDIPQDAGDDATFGTDGTGGTINLNGDVTLDALNFAGANAYTISPVGSETITMNGSSNINVQGAATHVIQTAIAGSNVLINGGGALTLDASNSFDGVTIEGTTVIVDSTDNLGIGNLTVDGATLSTGSALTLTQDIAFQNNGSTIEAGGNDLSISGTLSGDQDLTKAGAGALTLATDNSGYTGSIVVDGGALRISNGNQLGSGSTLTLNGTTLENTAATSVSQELAMGVGDGTIHTNGGDLQADGVLSGSTLLTKTGADKLTLTQDSSGTFTGDVSIDGGTISISAGNQLGAGSTLTLNGTTLENTATTSVNQELAMGTGGGTIDTNGGDLTANGALSGSTSLTKTGADKLTLTQDSSGTFTGDVSIGGGTISISAGNQLGAGSTVALDGGTLENTATTSVNQELAMGTGGGTIHTNGGDLTANGALSGSTSLTKTGADKLTLTQDSSGFTGNILINNGTLAVQNANALGDTGGTTEINKGTLLLDNVSVTGESLTMNGSGGANGATLAADGTSAWNADISGQAESTNRIISNSGTFTVSGNYTGSQAKELVLGGVGAVDMDGTINMATETQTLRKTGAGTVNLNSATNNFGNTRSRVVVEDGTLALNAAAFNDGTELAFEGGTLELNGFTHETGKLSGTSGTLDIGVGATLTIKPSDGDAGTMAADIISGGLIKDGSDTLTLSGNNTYAGGTVLNGGAITAGSSTALGASGSSFTMANNTGLNLEGDITIAGVSLGGVQGTGVRGDGAVRNLSGDNTWDGSATLAGNATVDLATGSSLTFDNGISGGAHDLTVTGGGTLQSNAAAAYTGNTNVTGSTIKLGANNAFAQTILNLSGGAMIDLNGFDQTFADINSSSSANTIAVNGNLTLDDGGTNQVLIATMNGTGNFEKAGAGTLTFSDGGTSFIDSTGYIGSITISAGSIELNSSQFENTSAFTVETGASLNLDNDITYSGNAIALNGGTISSSYSDGGTDIQTVSRNIDVTSDSSIEAFGTINSFSQDRVNYDGTITLNSSQLTVGGSGSDEVIIGDLQGTAGSALLVDRSSSLGEVTLSNANASFLGAAMVQDGILTVKNDDALSSAAAITVQSNGNLNIETAAMSGPTIGLNGGKVIGNSSGAIDNNIELQANSSVGGSGTLTINGNINETGTARTLTKEDSGHVIVAGVPGYTGSTVITGGTLSGNIPTTNLNLNGGAYGSSGTFNRAVGTGANEVQFGSSGGFSAVGGALDVNLGGAAGALNFGADLGTTLILNSSHTTNDITVINPLALNGQNATIRTDAQTAHINGGISGNGTLRKTGNGIVSLDSANTYTGKTTVNGGTLIANNANNTAFDDASALEINSGGEVVLNFDETVSQLDIDWSGDLSGTGTLSVTSQVNSASSSSYTSTATIGSGLNFTDATGNFDVSSSNQTLVVNGVISGPTAGIVKTGAGILELNNTGNTYDGTTTVNGGRIRIAGVDALGQNPAVEIGSSGYIGTEDNSVGAPQALVDIVSGTSTGTVGLDGGNTFAEDIDLTGKDPSLRIGSSSSATLTGSITPQSSSYRLGGGGGTLTVSSVLEDDGGARNVNIGANGSLVAGTVRLNGDNTYTGTTTLEEGTLRVGSANALGAGTSAIQLGTASGSSVTLVAESGVSRNINVVNSGGTTTLSGSGGFSGNVTGDGDVRVLSTSIDGTIDTATGDFIIDGSGGTTTLNSALSHNGSTIIEDDPFFSSDPRLEVTGNNFLFTSSPLIVNGDLDINNTTQSVAQLSGGSSGDIFGGSSGSLSFGSNGASTSYNGDFHGGNYTKQGAGVFTTNNINADSFTVAQGTVDANQISNNVTINSGATLDTDTGNIGTLSGGGDLVINGGANDTGMNVDDGTFSGDITGSGSLAKTSSGALTLQGTTSVGGALKVLQGTLTNSGTISTNVSVENNGTLQNNGTVDGPVDIGKNATLAGTGNFTDAVVVGGGLNPGNSAGTMTFGSDLTLENTSVTTMELVSASNHDILQVAGNLNLAGLLILDSLFSPNATGIELTLFDVTGSINGTFGEIQDSSGFWDTSNLNIDGTITSIQAVVPEPSTFLFLVGIGLLITIRRRK